MSTSPGSDISSVRDRPRIVPLPTVEESRAIVASLPVLLRHVGRQGSEKPSEFDGDLLWIHHDVQHMKARPNRKQVFSHVQGRYRPWKRLEDLKALRGSAKVPKRNGDATQSQTTTLTTFLGKGNSDPFGVYPVKIGAQENEVITFYRDVFLPAQYGMSLRIPNLDRLRKRDWEDCMNGFSDKGIAHGSLARWGQMLSRCNPRLQKVAVEHQYRSLQVLREKLNRGQSLQTFDNYLHINQLYSAETIGRNLHGATVHGRMLRKMFEQAWNEGTLDYKLLLWQVHNDIQTSAIFLVRPIFDVDGFLPTVYAPIWTAAAPDMPPLDNTNDDLDPSIEGPLVDLFKNIRKFWALCVILEQQGKNESASNALMTWCNNSQELISIGRLINHYHDVQQLLSQQTNQSLKNRMLVQQYLAVAAAYLAKSLNLNPVILGVPMFDARPALLPALRRALEDSEQLSTEAHCRKYMNARLWALYVGALAEQSHLKPGHDSRKGWFHVHLAEQAIAMNLFTWDTVQHVLLGFLYNDRVAPDGSLWFEKTIWATLDDSMDFSEGEDVWESLVF
jgi:hypothetical protein